MRQLHDEFGGDLPVILVSAERDRTHSTARPASCSEPTTTSLKPLDGGELLARIKRSLRRSAPVRRNGNGHGHEIEPESA